LPLSECKFNTNFILRKLLDCFYQKTFGIIFRHSETN